MESFKQVQCTPRVLLDDVTSFLSKTSDDKDRIVSLEERTECAIILLQSLPCARYAVLEKIGEVFFDEAQQYVIELERQHLDGLPLINEHETTKHDNQIKKIKQVLVEAVEANAKAWAPMIFQWAVQTLSQICGQYGTKRHFSTLSLQERFQMWLNCSATAVLLEIIVICLNKIIDKNQDNCLRCLLNATLSYSPYFNWALAHLSCTFAHIIPYKLLWNALEAFSNQSRKAEVVIETMLSIFQLIYPQKEEFIKDALLKLFLDSMVDLTDKKKTEYHTILCTIPFLLHISIKSIDLFMPVIDKLLLSMTHKNLYILQEQSTKRDVVLQRGLLRRSVDCIKMINQSGYKVILFLIQCVCKEDTKLCTENPFLATSVQKLCSGILELLRLQLKNDVYMYCHYEHNMQQTGEEPTKQPILTSLASYTKQLTQQMLTTSGLKKEILKEFLILVALQEGIHKMVEMLSLILLSQHLTKQQSCFMLCVSEFKFVNSDVVETTFEKLFKTLNSSYDGFSSNQVKSFFRNIYLLLKEEEETENFIISPIVKLYINEIAQVLILSKNGELCNISLRLLQFLCTLNLRISEYAVIVQAVLNYFFCCMKNIQHMEGTMLLSDACSELRICDELLVTITNEYKGIQQYVIRLLLEGILRKEEETFTTEGEEPIIKVELKDKNYSIMQDNRFSNRITSVMFKDGLSISKRKHEESDPTHTRYIHQLFINTLSNILSISTGFGPSKSSADVNSTFLCSWAEKQFTRAFPSAYAYTATLLVELICPDILPEAPWPDEDFLKYTIERDLKVKNTFESQPVLWVVLDHVSTARPSLFHCQVLIQSLFGMFLKFWQTNRNSSSSLSSAELNSVSRLMLIMQQGGWLPTEIASISDMFHLIKPKEVYEILSSIWKYLKITNFAPDRFIDRDGLGRPLLSVNTDHLQNVRSVIKVVFLRNISQLGHHYHRFLREHNP